jgi:tRNA G18 (ribose-2'-O)-methylase SpoU
MTSGGNALRGYFGIGVDGVSKPMNLGNLLRIAHAFEASFFFTVNGQVKLSDAESDTSRAGRHMPVYQFKSASELRLPQGCRLIGVEITDDAIDLPRFRHPTRAAYVFGAERLSLSPEVVKLCEYVVKIPTRFSINVGMAGAIVIYDRLLSLGGYPVRPIRPGGAADEPPPPHKWGGPIVRSRKSEA